MGEFNYDFRSLTLEEAIEKLQTYEFRLKSAGVKFTSSLMCTEYSGIYNVSIIIWELPEIN